MQKAISYNQPDQILWKILSVIFHPLFVPVYVIYILAFYHPLLFSGFSTAEKWRTVVISSINLVFFPLLTVVLLKALGFIDSLTLNTQKDRIIPFIAFGIFSFWAYTVFKNQTQYPREWASFVLGVFLASSAGLIANIYYKVSMHAIGMGGWAMILLLMTFSDNFPLPWLMALVLLLTGIVCTARLKENAHTPFEIYLGLIIGALSQVISWWYTF